MKTQHYVSLKFYGLRDRFKLEIITETESSIKFRVLNSEYLIIFDSGLKMMRVLDKKWLPFNITSIRSEYKRMGKPFREARLIFGFFNKGKYDGWRVEDVIEIDRKYVLLALPHWKGLETTIREVISKEKAIAKGKGAKALSEYEVKRERAISLAKELLDQTETFPEEYFNSEPERFLFGKYKGQLIESKVENDSSYVEWYKKTLEFEKKNSSEVGKKFKAKINNE